VVVVVVNVVVGGIVVVVVVNVVVGGIVVVVVVNVVVGLVLVIVSEVVAPPLPIPAAIRSVTENEAMIGTVKAAERTIFLRTARRPGSTVRISRSSFSSLIGFPRH
jgi:hypothetical protein